MHQRAVLAGGCFWGMQDLIRKRPGIISTRVGYTGGDIPNATYRNHGTHAEGIEIVFDPTVTSYRNILEFFFQIHDPTTLNRQGNDRGLSYRSGIYYVDEEQKRVAEDTIADVDASGLWDGKVVTEVQPVGEFWEAEPDHQDYLEKRPGGYTCHFVRPGWVLPKRQRLTTYSQRPGPRRNRLHCRCHCAGPVRNLRDRVVQRRGHRTLLQSDGSFQSVAIATPGSQIYARPLVLSDHAALAGISSRSPATLRSPYAQWRQGLDHA